MTAEIVTKVTDLRKTGLLWKEVARHVGLPSEACRKAAWLLKRSRRAVENSPPSQTAAAFPPEVPR